VVFVDRPATVLVFVIVIGALAASESADVVVIVIRKPQWLS